MRRPPTSDGLITLLEQLYDARQLAWQKELQRKRPNWDLLLALHLQMAELHGMRAFLSWREEAL